jgi:hypothetical protein
MVDIGRPLRVLVKWDEYMRMVRWLEELPQNQDGTDKSHVERIDRADREFFKRVKRVR